MHQYRPFLIPAIYIGGGLLLVGVSVFLVMQSGAFSSQAVEVIEASSSPIASQSAQPTTQITVEVAGAVFKPGVYTLPLGSRIQDALSVASGITKEADTAYVEKNINKASKISDGQKIYIPTHGENAPPVVMGTNTNSVGNESTLININSGSESELESLPGVGPATAAKIIAGRPYGSLEELLGRKAVSTKVFEEIKEKISL